MVEKPVEAGDTFLVVPRSANINFLICFPKQFTP